MRVLYLLVLCCLFNMTAGAQSTNWTGANSQSWSDMGNWTNGTPVTGGSAFIPATATNWPHMTGNLAIDFMLQNAGQLFVDGTADNFNNIQNFPGGVITVNGTAIHRGPNGFDNNGQVINNGNFTNYGPLNITGTGAFENRAGAVFINKDGGNLAVYASFLNAGNFTNDGFVTIPGYMTSTGTITNNKTLALEPSGQFIGRPASFIFNNTATAFIEIKGNMTLNAGSTFENLGGVRTAVGGILTMDGVFNNKSVVNNGGEMINNGTYNNGCSGCTDIITHWNEAGSSFRNNLTVNNFATLEILQCSKFYQNSANFSPITGKVWLMGIVYELKGTIDQSSIMGGIVLKNEADGPKPMAMCKSASVTLDAAGNASITPEMIDNMSTWDYCTGGGMTVSPATVNCSNVGTVQVTLTVRDYLGQTSSCISTVTVNASAACGNTSCITTANRTVTNNLVAGANCVAGQAYGVWLNGLVPGKSNYYQIQNGVFDEKADGTARLTGLAVNNSDANVKFTVDITFGGRTFAAPSGSPKTAGCYTINPSNWYYYTTTTGTLTGQGSQVGGLVKITRNGPSFQVGTGANLNEATQFGGSGWFLTQVISCPPGFQYVGNGGDVNFRLSGTPLFDCTRDDIDVTKCYKIINKYNGQALQLSSLNCNDGTALQTNTSGSGAGQVFGFTKNTDGTYSITVKTSGDLLDIYGGSLSDGAALIQWPAHGGANQRFSIQPVSGGFLKLIAKHSGKALSLQNCNTSTGNPVVQGGWAETCEQAKWSLVEVACVPVNCQAYSCNKNILFVVDCPSYLNCGDAAIKNKLTGKGFSVVVKSDYSVTAADATGKGLVLISSTVNSSYVNTKFNNVAVPVMTWESQLYDDLDLCSSNYGVKSAYYNYHAKTQSSHSICNGYSGNFNLFNCKQDVSYGVPNHSSNSLCNLYNDASKSAVICYEKGQNMCNGKTAKDKRIAFCGNDNSASTFTSEGWKLFLNAVYYATNCPNVGYAQSNPNEFVFNAYKSNFDVQVKWINRKAADVAKYAVERSTDGINWSEITSFDSDLETEYFAEFDKNPAAGDNFYRLRMTHLDGTEIVSDEEMVYFAKTETYTAFPNPAIEETFLDLRDLAGRPATVRFVNSMGKTAKTVEFDMVGDEPVRLQTADLINGLWLLQVESEGLRPVTIKLMVSHLD